MLKKHKKELVMCCSIPILIVVLVLALVSIFEFYGIHVPGSREMWIGFIGSIIGGAFTLIGVLITIYKEEEVQNEQVRLLNMPILIFETYMDGLDGSDMILSIMDNELMTSGFPDYERKGIAKIRISLGNDATAFDFTIQDCMINRKKIAKGDAFNPSKSRIIKKDSLSLIFNPKEVASNIFCVIRMSYKDIFGNLYYQDLPFTYMETTMKDKYEIEQIISIRDIKQPILVNKKMKSLEETMKEYIDYDVFCNMESR